MIGTSDRADVAAGVTWWPAPAKLNLFLHITARRADGYHDLQTYFQLIDHCDEIGIALRSDGQIRRPQGADGVAEDQDLVVRAARKLRARALEQGRLEAGEAPRLGADLRIIKHNPMGGGVGGGSSDAATTLLVLNQLWRLGFNVDDLAAIGGEIGADVPVFVRGHSAWAGGRGELLVPAQGLECWFAVVHPGVAVSTSEIFQAPELTRNSPMLTMGALPVGEVLESCSNVCEPVVRVRYPPVAAALDWLNDQLLRGGLEGRARMTGTGACVFAPFAEREQAVRVIERIRSPWRGFVARSVQRSPLLAQLAAVANS